MTDIEVDFETDEEVEVEADEAEEPEAEQAEASDEKADKPKRKKHDLPEGWETPARMIHVLKERDICDITPQQMFGFVKNGKDFPKNEDGSPFLHTDGRYIVPIERTCEWVVGHLQKREERAAKRAQKEASDKAESENTEEDSSEE